MIFQHSGVEREARPHSLLRLWPFWLVLVVFETALWLLLALKFAQPCAPVALAVGLTAGLAIQSARGRGLSGLAWAVGLTALVIALVLYGQAAFHVARVLGLSPLQALTGTGLDFARAVLDGLLRPVDWAYLTGGLVMAALLGFNPTRRRATDNQQATG